MPHTITQYHSFLKSFYSDPTKLGGPLPFSQEEEDQKESTVISPVDTSAHLDTSFAVRQPTPRTEHM